jgi:hypothetical protein
MNKNLFLLFIILVIMMIVSSKEKVHKILPTYKNKRKPCVTEDPCFLYENTNRSQILYLKLITALKNLSCNKKKTLGKNCKQNVFIQGTTSNRLKTELDQVTKIILDKINSMTGFFFKKIYYDTITIFEDHRKNKNFLYNVFVYDSHEEMEIRLYINVIKYAIECPSKRKAITCASVTTPGMDTYEIGYPQPEQLLPLPTEVISTSGAPDLLSVRGINIKKIDPIKYLYINEVKIYNTNSVINANGKCLMDAVCGNIKDTSLSSSLFNQPTTPFQESACVSNKWPKLLDEPDNVVAWPAATESPYWNSLGIPTPATCNSQKCGIRSSTTQYPFTPEYWPTLATIPRNSGIYANIFSLTRGDPATEGADFTD